MHDLLNDPAHVHVRAGDAEVKFWLDPIRIAWNRGHMRSEIARIERLILESQQLPLERWQEEQGKRR